MDQIESAGLEYLTIATETKLRAIASEIRPLILGVACAVDVLPTEAPDKFEVLLTMTVQERDTGVPLLIQKAWFCYLPSTVTEVIQNTRDVMGALVLHERDEGFYFGGRRIFDPHV